MPKIVAPLTDAQVKNAKPKEKSYKLADGGGLYLEVMPTDSKLWRMKFKQANGKESRLAFGNYPAVTVIQARQKRDAARKLKFAGIDPSQHKRDEKQIKAFAAAHTFEAVARQWLEKSAANRSASTKEKVIAWLENDVFPSIGSKPISIIGPRDVLATVQKMEARGAIDSAHRVKQLCGQVFRHAVASGLVERDVTADLKGALSVARKTNHAAITEPKQVGELIRAIYGYSGHHCAMAALKLSPLVFVRPGELRSAEWAEIVLDAAEWRIPGSKMKMKVDHIVPLSMQAVEILRSIQPLTGHGKYVFPSIRTGEQCMSENTIESKQQAFEFVFPCKHPLDGAETFFKNIVVENLFSTALGCFSSARILVDVGRHPAIENGFPIQRAIVDAIQADDAAPQIKAHGFGDTRQLRQCFSQERRLIAVAGR